MVHIQTGAERIHTILKTEILSIRLKSLAHMTVTNYTKSEHQILLNTLQRYELVEGTVGTVWD